MPASKLKGLAKPMIVAGLELLEQARRDEQATVELVPPAVPKRELSLLQPHERVWHVPLKCNKVKYCIGKHCCANPADAWMMVSISAEAAELAFASGGR